MFKKLGASLCVFALGLLIGLFASSSSSSSSSSKEVRAGQYQFINPLLECDLVDQDSGFGVLKPFKNKIVNLTKKIMDAGKASQISVYFRDLNNGPWFGINEQEKFSPGSLLKTGIMIAALKQAEDDPNFLLQNLTYRGGTSNASMLIKPDQVLEVGKTYRLDNLIYRMIAYSDNDAKDLVLSKINGKILNNTYIDLGVTSPTTTITDDFIGVQNYASFFRILFNASYLSREFSNLALKILSESKFTTGLVAGVPNDVLVAHKFGEREYLGKKQLHDCGVVYFPNHPYLLCVMNRGDDINVLGKNIAEISKAVYEEVAAQAY